MMAPFKIMSTLPPTPLFMSEPHTSMTSLRSACVCIFTRLLGFHTYRNHLHMHMQFKFLEPDTQVR